MLDVIHNSNCLYLRRTFNICSFPTFYCLLPLTLQEKKKKDNIMSLFFSDVCLNKRSLSESQAAFKRPPPPQGLIYFSLYTS